MADITWEQALQMLGASDLKVVGRNDVAVGSPTWHVKDSGGVLVTGPHPGPPPAGTTDITAAPAYRTIPGGYVATPVGVRPTAPTKVQYEGDGGTDGVKDKMGNWGDFFTIAYSAPWDYETDGGPKGTVDWAKIGAQFDETMLKDGPYANFVKQTATVLDPLKDGKGGNDRFSVPSLIDASMWLGQMDTWLTARIDDLKALLHGTGEGDGGWQGKAADGFTATVEPLRRQFFALHVGLDVASLQADLKASEDAMVSAVQKMHDAVEQWKNHPYYDPHKAYLAALQQTTNAANFKFIRNGGRHLEAASPQDDPAKPEFWGRVDTLAKQYWLSSLGALDRGAAEAVATLGPSYLSLNSLIGGVTSSLTVAGHAPGGPNGTSDDPHNKVPSLDDILKGLGGDQAAGKGSGAGAGGPGNGGVGNNGVGVPGHGKGPGSARPDTGARPAGSLPGGTGGEVFGPDGKPVLGADGRPLFLPPGAQIRPNGSVVDRTGKPILGSNAKPLTVPPNSRIKANADGRPSDLFGPDGGAGRGGLTVPPGSTVKPDGSVIGPDGKSVLGANGRPLTLPHGSTVGPDGTVRGPDGSVLGPDGSPMAVAPPLRRPDTSSLGDVGLDPGALSRRITTSGGPFGGGGGGLGGGVDTGAAVQAAVGSDGRLIADAVADPAALTASAKGIGAEGLGGAAGRASGAASLASGDGRLAGEGAQGGMPFMPMGGMGGMGGGIGGGAGPGSRRTWLVEDEDVWGTEVVATSGVIGRGEPPAGRVTTPRRQSRPQGVSRDLTTAGPDRARDGRATRAADEARGRTAAATADHGGGDG